uniref:hypothetical protein n=1 Tax=Eubacterium cellulosolvens TaxID=29322 RepID=UPI0004864D84|nr:hypothetical protein [[Eubacterium] cellulosolvens]
MKKESIQPVSKVQAVTAVKGSNSENLNIEDIEILVWRRYNIIKEIKKLTDDLGEACDRQDNVSMDLILQMRQDQLELCAGNWETLMLLGEKDAQSAAVMRHLLRSDPETEEPRSDAEKQIFDIRRKMHVIMEEVKRKDKMINMRTARTESYYTKLEEKSV